MKRFMEERVDERKVADAKAAWQERLAWLQEEEALWAPTGEKSPGEANPEKSGAGPRQMRRRHHQSRAARGAGAKGALGEVVRAWRASMCGGTER